MSISDYYNNILQFQQKNDSWFNTIANHLIVIFAFFLPVSMSGRSSTFFLIFTLFLLRGNYWSYLKDGLKDKLVQAFFIYFCVHVIWLLGTDNFIEAKKVLHEAKILLYPLLFITFIDKRYIPRMFAAYFLGMLCSELWSYGIFFEWLPPHPHDIDQGGPSDPTPIYHHTHYGFMLAITLTLVLQRLIYEADKLALKAVFGFFFITASINLFITAGRTGYVLYLIMLFTLFMLIFKKRVWLAVAYTLAICVTAFTLAFSFSNTFHHRIINTATSLQGMSQRNDFDTPLGNRIALWKGSEQIILDNIWFGVGTGDHMDVVRADIAKHMPQFAHIANAMQHMHNEYLSSVLQFGIAGLLSFLYIVFQLIRYPQEDVPIKNMQIILAVGIAAFSFIDIMILGLAALLVTVTLVSFSFRKYVAQNAVYSQLTPGTFAKYTGAVVILELISWIT